MNIQRNSLRIRRRIRRNKGNTFIYSPLLSSIPVSTIFSNCHNQSFPSSSVKTVNSGNLKKWKRQFRSSLSLLPSDSANPRRRPIIKRFFSSSSNDEIPPKNLVKIVAEWIQESSDGGKANILVLCGAGVSVAAGLPDFRSPGTGLYDNLQRYNLPYAEAVFDLEYYREHPQAFMSLAKDIWPGLQHEQQQKLKQQHRVDSTVSSPSPPSPTLTHSFLALLEQNNALRRCYSQNIDGLEFIGGVSADRMVECHGHFRTASCINCDSPANIEEFKDYVLQGATEPPMCEKCLFGFVKPDIVFFGELLPSRLHQCLGQDLAATDLLLIMGTSLHVAPVSTIPNMVLPSCRRVLLNRDLVGNLRIDQLEKSQQPRDVFLEGDCDDSVLAVCRALGWEEKLLKQNEATRS